jgi:manganese/zinc/iron transport system substrate-binding protein
LSTRDIQHIVEHLIHYQIRIVFPESNISPDSLKKIVHACRQKGLEVEICSSPLYGDAMGNRGSHAENYLNMIRHNAEVMMREWKKER